MIGQVLLQFSKFPSSTPTAAFQRSRHFRARLFPRPFLTRSEGSRVQTNQTSIKQPSHCRLHRVQYCSFPPEGVTGTFGYRFEYASYQNSITRRSWRCVRIRIFSHSRLILDVWSFLTRTKPVLPAASTHS